MKVHGRNGDYAMCCAVLRAPIDLDAYESATADVYALENENKVEVKLEEDSKHIFTYADAFDAGRRETPPYFLLDVERTWNPKQVCLAAIGNGPPRNELRLYSVTLK